MLGTWRMLFLILGSCRYDPDPWRPSTCVGSEGATMLAVWHAMACKPEGLPEVAAATVVSSGACLSSLPCSH